MLLALGFGAGAVGALDPNALFGQELISAVVSVAVGIILFEAGLGLKLSTLIGAVAQVPRRLVTVGLLVTWAIGTVAAYLLFNLSFEVALVLGAVLVVSGPTVVGPLLDFIRPSKKVNVVLKWEGTLAGPRLRVVRRPRPLPASPIGPRSRTAGSPARSGRRTARRSR